MIEQIVSLLQLPESCLVRKKITKAFFKRNFELTGAERALLDDFTIVLGVEWIASISPANSNIPGYSAEGATFEELPLIALQSSDEAYEANRLKLADFIQKFIPYHVVVIIYCNQQVMFNTCYKRINQNDANKRTTDKKFSTQTLSLNAENENEKAFYAGLAYSNLDKTNLKTVYDSYTQQIVGLQTAGIKGGFSARSAERTKQDVEYLEQINLIEKEIVQLQIKAKKESQMNRRVELNTQIQAKKKEIDRLKTLIID